MSIISQLLLSLESYSNFTAEEIRSAIEQMKPCNGIHMEFLIHCGSYTRELSNEVIIQTLNRKVRAIFKTGKPNDQPILDKEDYNESNLVSLIESCQSFYVNDSE